ncbi:MAG: tail fiber domain-containing protein [Bacteroidia bacterium]|nr:tail fiber domain-containing protein [Bacteroidia bacterium]
MNNNATILHLKLDEISQQKVKDSISNKFSGEVVGDPSIVPDDHFGACLRLNGDSDYIQVPPSDSYNFETGSFTVYFWVRINESVDVSTEMCMVLSNYGRGGSDSRPDLYQAYFQAGTRKLTFEIRDSDNKSQAMTTQSAFIPGTWYGVSYTRNVDTGRISLAVNNVVEAEKDLEATGVISPGHALLVGGREKYQGEGIDYRFNGSVANVRLMRSALAASEIALLLDADQTSHASFKRTHPLDFSLRNRNDEEVLYIEREEEGYDMVLRIRNVGERSLVLPAVSATQAGPEAHHFQLMFRPGVIEEEVIRQLSLKESDWILGSQQHPDGTLSLYFLLPAGTSLEAGASLYLTLQQVNAAQGGGSRSTKVELSFRQLYFAGEANFPFDGYRVSHLDIISHYGKASLPLMVSIVGSDTVLNDSVAGDASTDTATSITLRFVNMASQSEEDAESGVIPFSISSAAPEGRTRFSLLFDHQGDTGLAKLEELREINVNVVKQDEVIWCAVAPPRDQGANLVYELEPLIEQLRPGQAVELRLDNIKTTKSSGLSNLYVLWENIPGYNDGYEILSIEKTPIVHRHVGSTGKKNVGIGIMPDANARLKVGGDLQVLGNLALTGGSRWIGPAKGKGITIAESGQVGIGTESPDEVLVVANSSSSTKLSGDRLIFNRDGSGYFDKYGNGGMIFRLGSEHKTHLSIATDGVTVSEALKVQGALTAEKSVTVNGALAVSGLTEAKGGLTVTGSTQALGSLTIGGDTLAKGAFTVEGAAQAKGSLTVQGSLQAQGGLTVEKYIDNKGSLSVAGTTTTTGLLTLKGGLDSYDHIKVSSGSLLLKDDYNVAWGETQATRINGSQSRDNILFVVANKQMMAVEKSAVQIETDLYVKGNIYVQNPSTTGSGGSGVKDGEWYRLSTDKSVSRNNWSTTEWKNLSDARLKTAVQPLDPVLGRVMQLRPVSYRWSEQGLALNASDRNCQPAELDRTHRGFIAQELENTYPEWVGTRDDGFRAINLDELPAVAIQAIRELKLEKDREIEELRAELARLNPTTN